MAQLFGGSARYDTLMVQAIHSVIDIDAIKKLSDLSNIGERTLISFYANALRKIANISYRQFLSIVSVYLTIPNDELEEDFIIRTKNKALLIENCLNIALAVIKASQPELGEWLESTLNECITKGQAPFIYSEVSDG